MSTSFGYVLTSTTAPPSTSSTAAEYPASSESRTLGYGIITPFRRDRKSDFATSGGERLVKSCVGQILGTRASDEAGNSGELPWRPRFGSLLHKLRHRNNDEVLEHIARVYVVDSIRKWEPRVSVREASIAQAKTSTPLDTLRIHTKYEINDVNSPENRVTEQEVDV